MKSYDDIKNLTEILNKDLPPKNSENADNEKEKQKFVMPTNFVSETPLEKQISVQLKNTLKLAEGKADVDTIIDSLSMQLPETCAFGVENSEHPLIGFSRQMIDQFVMAQKLNKLFLKMSDTESQARMSLRLATITHDVAYMFQAITKLLQMAQEQGDTCSHISKVLTLELPNIKSLIPKKPAIDIIDQEMIKECVKIKENCERLDDDICDLISKCQDFAIAYENCTGLHRIAILRGNDLQILEQDPNSLKFTKPLFDAVKNDCHRDFLHIFGVTNKRCPQDHDLQRFTKPKSRKLALGTTVGGEQITCDNCEKQIDDLADGYYSCVQNCDYDLCVQCACEAEITGVYVEFLTVDELVVFNPDSKKAIVYSFITEQIKSETVQKQKEQIASIQEELSGLFKPIDNSMEKKKFGSEIKAFINENLREGEDRCSDEDDWILRLIWQKFDFQNFNDQHCNLENIRVAFQNLYGSFPELEVWINTLIKLQKLLKSSSLKFELKRIEMDTSKLQNYGCRNTQSSFMFKRAFRLGQSSLSQIQSFHDDGKHKYMIDLSRQEGVCVLDHFHSNGLSYILMIQKSNIPRCPSNEAIFAVFNSEGKRVDTRRISLSIQNLGDKNNAQEIYKHYTYKTRGRIFINNEGFVCGNFFIFKNAATKEEMELNCIQFQYIEETPFPRILGQITDQNKRDKLFEDIQKYTIEKDIQILFFDQSVNSVQTELPKLDTIDIGLLCSWIVMLHFRPVFQDLKSPTNRDDFHDIFTCLVISQRKETYKAIRNLLRQITNTSRILGGYVNNSDPVKKAKVLMLRQIYKDVRTVLMCNLYSLERRQKFTLNDIFGQRDAHEIFYLVTKLDIIMKFDCTEYDGYFARESTAILARAFPLETERQISFFLEAIDEFQPQNKEVYQHLCLLVQKNMLNLFDDPKCDIIVQKVHSFLSKYSEEVKGNRMMSKMVEHLCIARILQMGVFSHLSIDQVKDNFMAMIVAIENKSSAFTCDYERSVMFKMLCITLLTREQLLSCQRTRKALLNLSSKVKMENTSYSLFLSIFVVDILAVLQPNFKHGAERHEIEPDSAAEKIISSDLFSGGLVRKMWYKLDERCLQEMSRLALQMEDKSLSECISEAIALKVQPEKQAMLEKTTFSHIRSLLEEDKDEVIEMVVQGLQYCLQQRGGQISYYVTTGGDQGNALTRYAFASIVKLSGFHQRFEEIHIMIEKDLGKSIPREEGEERNKLIQQKLHEVDKEGYLLDCWAHASTMRRWLMMKKQGLGEKFKQQSFDDEMEAQALISILDKIKAKTELLLSLYTPQIFRENEKGDQIRASILAFLQSPISADTIKSHIANSITYGIRRIVIYNKLKLLINAFSNQDDQETYCAQKLFISIFTSLLQPDQKKPAHYLDGIRGCGNEIELQLRDCFFEILESLAYTIQQSKNVDEVLILLHGFKSNFLTRDFENLCIRIQIWNLLFRGGDQLDNIINQCQISSQQKSSDNQKLKDALKQTFSDIFIQIVARISESKEIQSVNLKVDGFTSIPNLTRSTTIMDQDSALLIVSSAFSEMFRVFSRTLSTFEQAKSRLCEMIASGKVEEISRDTFYQNFLSANQPTDSEDSKTDLVEETKEEVGQISLTIRDKECSNNEDKNDDDDWKSETDSEQNKKKKKPELSKKILMMKLNETFSSLMEKEYILQFLGLISLLVNVSQIQHHVCEILLKVMTSNYIRILLQVLVLVNPQMKLNILKVLESLLHLQISIDHFDQACGDPIEFGDTIQSNIGRKFESTPFVKFLIEYAISIRQSSIKSKQKFTYAVSKRLIGIAIQVSTPSTFNSQVEECLIHLGDFCKTEIGVIFELVGSGLCRLEAGDKVKLSEKAFNMHQMASVNNPCEVIQPMYIHASYRKSQSKVKLFMAEENLITRETPQSLVHVPPRLKDGSVFELNSELVQRLVQEQLCDSVETNATALEIQACIMKLLLSKDPSYLTNLSDKIIRNLYEWLLKQVQCDDQIEKVKKILKGDCAQVWNRNSISILEEHLAFSNLTLVQWPNVTNQVGDDMEFSGESDFDDYGESDSEFDNMTEPSEVDGFELESSESSKDFSTEKESDISGDVEHETDKDNQSENISRQPDTFGRSLVKRYFNPTQKLNVKEFLRTLRSIFTLKSRSQKGTAIINMLAFLLIQFNTSAQRAKFIQSKEREFYEFRDKQSQSSRKFLLHFYKDFLKQCKVCIRKQDVTKVQWKKQIYLLWQDIEASEKDDSFEKLFSFIRTLECMDTLHMKASWRQLSVKSDLMWLRIKKPRKHDSVSFAYYLGAGSSCVKLHKQLTKLDRQKPGLCLQLLVKKLSEKLFFNLFSVSKILNDKSNAFNLQYLLRIYQENKVTKYFWGKYASWANQPKSFDSQICMQSLYKFLQNGKMEIAVDMIKESLDQLNLAFYFERSNKKVKDLVASMQPALLTTKLILKYKEDKKVRNFADKVCNYVTESLIVALVLFSRTAYTKRSQNVVQLKLINMLKHWIQVVKQLGVVDKVKPAFQTSACKLMIQELLPKELPSHSNSIIQISYMFMVKMANDAGLVEIENNFKCFEQLQTFTEFLDEDTLHKTRRNEQRIQLKIYENGKIDQNSNNCTKFAEQVDGWHRFELSEDTEISFNLSEEEGIHEHLKQQAIEFKVQKYEYRQKFAAISPQPNMRDPNLIKLALSIHQQKTIKLIKGIYYFKYPLENDYILQVDLNYGFKSNKRKHFCLESFTTDAFSKNRHPNLIGITSFGDIEENSDNKFFAFFDTCKHSVELRGPNQRNGEITEFKIPFGIKIKEIMQSNFVKKFYKQFYQHFFANDKDNTLPSKLYEFTSVLTECGRIGLIPTYGEHYKTLLLIPNTFHSKVKKVKKAIFTKDTLFVVNQDDQLIMVVMHVNKTTLQKKIKFYEASQVQLRNGSKIAKVLDLYVQHSSENNQSSFMLLKAITDQNQEVVCSKCNFDFIYNKESLDGLDGDFGIGRKPSEKEPAEEFHILDYDFEKTSFKQISLSNGIAMGIDQKGDLWILAGRQNSTRNAGYHRLEAIRDRYPDCFFHQPVRHMSTMDVRHLKALQVQCTDLFTLVKAQNRSTQKLEYVVLMPEEDQKPYFLQKNFKNWFEQILTPQLNQGDLELVQIVTSQDLRMSQYPSIYNEVPVLFWLRSSTTATKTQTTGMRKSKIVLNVAIQQKSSNKEDLIENLSQSVYVKLKNLLTKQATQCFAEKKALKFLSSSEFKRSNKGFVKLFNLFFKAPQETVILDSDHANNEDEEEEVKMINTSDTSIKQKGDDTSYITEEFANLKDRFVYLVQQLFRHGMLMNFIMSNPFVNQHETEQKLVQKFLAVIENLDFSLLVKELTNKYAHLTNRMISSKIKLRRLAAQAFKEQKKYEESFEAETMFSQIYMHFRSKKGYRVFGRSAFRFGDFVLIGEGSCDAGGPMREVYSNLADELMSTSVLPLFVPTANNLANVQPYIDCFRLNPHATENHFLSKIVFVGYFIGWAILSSGGLNLYLPSAFWNRICKGGTSYVYTMDDLKSMDVFRYILLTEMKKAAQTMSDEEFQVIYFDQSFTADFDGTNTLDLCPGGSTKPLTRQNVPEYIDLYLQKYSQLDQMQFSLLMRGINETCGKRILDLITPDIAKRRASASASLTVEQIKNITSDQKEGKQTIKWFWEIVSEMSNQDRLLLQKFWTGRSRIRDGQSQEISIEYQTDKMPVAHTCSYEIALSENYTSKEKFKKLLLTAIHFCGEIDMDNSYRESEDSSEMDDYQRHHEASFIQSSLRHHDFDKRSRGSRFNQKDNFSELDYQSSDLSFTKDINEEGEQSSEKTEEEYDFEMQDIEDDEDISAFANTMQ